MKLKKWLLLSGLVLASGSLLPEAHRIPVEGAGFEDWNPKSFWYSPWGRSGTHKGIDIFAKEGTPVQAASPGFVVYLGNDEVGGLSVLMLGAKWRLFYYAHLHEVKAKPGAWLSTGDVLGTVGSTGNAQGKPPHLHFAIRSLLPMLSQYDAAQVQAWRKMFYLNPNEYLRVL